MNLQTGCVTSRNPRSLLRVVVLLTLVVSVLTLLSRVGHASADDRVLRVQDGDAVREYPLANLIDAIGLTELRVAKDPHFGPDRVFAGFALEPLLSHIGLGDSPALLLVCADGYRIPFDVSALAQRPLRALLAVRDTALPADSKTHWLSYQHGPDTISFDPFYLVWAGGEKGADPDTETLPWPFQLTEIHRFDRDTYYAPAQPPTDAGDAVREGFAIYTAHCGKCHRMRGVGGDVGPALDRDYSLSSLLTSAQLSDYIRHDESRFPQSKMPPFSKRLSATEIEQVSAYLQAMQPER